MDKKKKAEAKPGTSKLQESSDQLWERNRMLNEIQYLMDAGKTKEAKLLKKKYAELVKQQRERNK
jgi:hypothetical protein